MEANVSLDELYSIHSKIISLKRTKDRLNPFIQKMLEPKCVPNISHLYEIMMPPFTDNKTKDKRKLAARIIFDICSVSFDMLFLISEKLNFSPLTGKICLNSIPKALTYKFNDNHELYNELKQFIGNSALIENNRNSFWTFPDFKSSSNDGQDLTVVENINNIEFPDPKYYMIGLRVEKSDCEQDNNFSDWEISQTATKETLKLSTNVRSMVNDDDDSVDANWKNATTTSFKNSIRKIDTNKERKIDLKKSYGMKPAQKICNKICQPKFGQHAKKISSQNKTCLQVPSKNYSMLKKYLK